MAFQYFLDVHRVYWLVPTMVYTRLHEQVQLPCSPHTSSYPKVLAWACSHVCFQWIQPSRPPDLKLGSLPVDPSCQGLHKAVLLGSARDPIIIKRFFPNLALSTIFGDLKLSQYLKMADFKETFNPLRARPITYDTIKKYFRPFLL